MNESAASGLVVVAVRGDDTAVPALRWAARSAAARGSAAAGADLEVLIAWDLPAPPSHMPRELREASRSVLAEMRWALEDLIDRSQISTLPGIRISTTVVAAPARAALAEVTSRAGLLVIGASRHPAAHAPLSVGRRTAAIARCPVVLVPADGAQPGSAPTGDRFVVGMDGSPHSLAAFQWASDEAARRGLPVTVVAVGPGEGDPGEVLAQQSLGAEALVLGQHGGGWIARQLPALGSVSRWSAAYPVCPVVIVPCRRPAQRE